MDWKHTAEYQRLIDSELRRADWKHWGPYLSERAWGTVREDYSAKGDAWENLPHDHARSRAYRWNEDGLGGISNRFQNLCLAVALWNGKDPFLKERLFGLSGPEGNHGEDVKEYYYYLDSTPTHSYLKMLYKYPQVPYPYAKLVEENKHRTFEDPEYELIDALRSAFQQNLYFDVLIEYAKAGQDDIFCRISATNRAAVPAPLHILPHLWARNTWSWGYDSDSASVEGQRPKPVLAAIPPSGRDFAAVYVNERHLGERWWYVKTSNQTAPQLLFTENDTNLERLYGTPNPTPYVKDGIHDAVVNSQIDKVNPDQKGTKVAAHFTATVNPGQTFAVWTRFTDVQQSDPFESLESTFQQRIEEADDFYASIQRPGIDKDEQHIQRQAFAGLMWSKQFYHYSVELWLKGDPGQPNPPAERLSGRNASWQHLYNLDVISMPDKWEYPWYAVWDLAFHTIPIAMIDPEWAKRQLVLMLREWYMHPNGQIPAYEWAFGDVNPPVHAWAAWRVYQITAASTGVPDTPFLERIFHKLLLNFTWWVNRKDHDENNVFQGGFLGLDNIGIFDRSKPLPTGGHIDQADGTAWMGMYCLNMLRIALELAQSNAAYEDIATKFFEHFIYIADALTHLGGHEFGIWHPGDGFFYDMLHLPDDRVVPLKVRSYVGLIPLFAVETIETELLDKLPRFKRRMDWFIKYRPHLLRNVASLTSPNEQGTLLLSLVDSDKLKRVCARMFDTAEFLSPFGLRSLSKVHQDQPYTFYVDQDHMYSVSYEPGESQSGMFGGNSNWRGPIWFPTNYLIIESLRKFGAFYGTSLTVEVPMGSGSWLPLKEAADELSRRLIALFKRDPAGKCPIHGEEQLFQDDRNWNRFLTFPEYFHGDSGKGLGASHQTGWTALVAKLINENVGGETCATRVKSA